MDECKRMDIYYLKNASHNITQYLTTVCCFHKQITTKMFSISRQIPQTTYLVSMDTYM